MSDDVRTAVTGVVGGVVVLGVIFVIGELQRDQQRAHVERERDVVLDRTQTLRDQLSNVVAESRRQFPRRWLEEPVGDASQVSAKFVAPCVVVDISSSPAIWLPWYDWPPALRASTPDEVRTVVLLRETEEQVCTYDDGNTQGLRVDYAVWLVDWPKRRVVASALLRGEDPPRHIRTLAWDVSFHPIRGKAYPLMDLFQETHTPAPSER